MHRRCCSTLIFALFACGPVLAAPRPAEPLLSVAPTAGKTAVRLAVQAMHCAVNRGVPAPSRLAVIDYSRPSTEPRLWVFDLAANKLLYQERVAHGRNSGENRAATFSNAAGSFASSLGLFRTRDTYVGRNGYSLRMQGLEPGFNDNAMSRAIVIHGADYVSDAFVRKVGRIGRSLGCPAVRRKVAHALIDTIQGGQFVFSYYPDPEWLAQSRFVNCAGSGPTPLSATVPAP